MVAGNVKLGKYEDKVPTTGSSRLSGAFWKEIAVNFTATRFRAYCGIQRAQRATQIAGHVFGSSVCVYHENPALPALHVM